MEKIICWDTAVLIDLIQGDAALPNRIPLIKDVLNLERSGACQLIFSVLIYPELLYGNPKMPANSKKLFDQFVQNTQRISIIAVDVSIAKKAQEIRSKTNIKTPDAIHIATAIVHKADVFHTHDEGLLKWTGKPEVDNLFISKHEIPGLGRNLFASLNP